MIRDCSGNFVDSLLYSSHIRQYLKDLNTMTTSTSVEQFRMVGGMNCAIDYKSGLNRTEKAPSILVLSL